MATRPSVLFDLDVILDALQRREPFFDVPARALGGAETGQVHGWVAARSLTTLFCLLVKHQSAEQARVALTGLMATMSVAQFEQAVIEQALDLPYPDFEDAVQMMAAVRSSAKYLITCNVQDYEAGPLPVLQPAEVMALV